MPSTETSSEPWSIERARTTYSLRHWGDGYFDVSDAGHMIVRPDRNPDHAGIDLYALAGEIQASGLPLPVLARFVDVLHDRVDVLCAAFADATAASGFAGHHTAVYPIKVNQQRSVVEAIANHGGARVGLEAGSKPELTAILALLPETGTIVCNGYKDREYIRRALIGQQLGHRVYIVVEKLSELERVIEAAQQMEIRPRLGLRMRLATIGKGNWQNTGGEKAKFGLSATEVLRVIDRLRESAMLDSLQMLHFHLGSQIANLADIERGVGEAARHYAALRQLGAAIDCVDVGGGLGIDYEGTRSRSFCSINYSLSEYAAVVVQGLSDICAAHGLPHPDIITESGRAMTAHHAVLITNVIDCERIGGQAQPPPVTENEPEVIHKLWHALSDAGEQRSGVETFHAATQDVAQARQMYVRGELNLQQRARAEQIYVAILRAVQAVLQPRRRGAEQIVDELNEVLADRYFCNFSIFQSTPDVWGIDQVFPVVPLHRLDEAPTRRGVIRDLTCDSDGRIDRYVDSAGVESTLPLHAPRSGEPYLLGIFLLGAYQEILGDMHNLFGDTNSVDVQLTVDGGHQLVHKQHGDTVAAVLRYVHIHADELRRAYADKLAQTDLNQAQRDACLDELERGLDGYTYLLD